MRRFALQFRHDDFVHVGDGFEDAFAAVTLRVAIAEFNRFADASGRATRHAGRGGDAVVERDTDHDGRVAARVEDFLCVYLFNFSHIRSNGYETRLRDSMEISFLLFDDEHAAMSVISDAVGGVAEQTAPQLGVVAVPNDDQVVTVFVGDAQNGFGRMAAACFAADVNPVPLCHAEHLCGRRCSIRRRLPFALTSPSKSE